MRIGLLWFDDDPKRDLEEKIGRAVERYRQRMDRAPSVCYMNPSQINGQNGQQVAGVRVAALPTVLPHHFWVGCEEQPQAARPAPPANRPEAGAEPPAQPALEAAGESSPQPAARSSRHKGTTKKKDK